MKKVPAILSLLLTLSTVSAFAAQNYLAQFQSKMMSNQSPLNYCDVHTEVDLGTNTLVLTAWSTARIKCADHGMAFIYKCKSNICTNVNVGGDVITLLPDGNYVQNTNGVIIKFFSN
jgi:hypothetical protein